MTSSSSAYKDVVRWADELKTRGEVLVAFHHEPESSQSDSYGSASQYISAYRKVVDIFRAEGATNVAFTWQMTAYAFAVDSSADNAAAKWYPGDSYVDVVAIDPYNWYTCGEGKGKWNSLSSLVSNAVTFARSHDKQMALAEFASVKDSRRAQWIKDAGTYLAANDDLFVAAFYFNRAPTYAKNSDCTWPLSSSADFAAMREVAQMSAFKS